VKFLVDECLTPRVAERLVAAGHDAVHVGEVGLLGSPDADVMAEATASGRVVVSADTDFGELLAKGRHALPSVILLRRHHGPDGQASAIVRALKDVEEFLLAGAVVVITEDRLRIRSLPIA
jgi:predicted nuclease of predicted toxin-antitoxin system